VGGGGKGWGEKFRLSHPPTPTHVWGWGLGGLAYFFIYKKIRPPKPPWGLGGGGGGGGGKRRCRREAAYFFFILKKLFSQGPPVSHIIHHMGEAGD